MRKLLIIVVAISITLPILVSAHSGRTNSEGCHNDRRAGDYHCHNSSVLKEAKYQARTNARTEARKFNEVDHDCADFSSQFEAQTFYEENGGASIDPHDLDRDKDGIACENL